MSATFRPPRRWHRPEWWREYDYRRGFRLTLAVWATGGEVAFGKRLYRVRWGER